MSDGVGEVVFQSVGKNEQSATRVWVLNSHVHSAHELIVVMTGSQYVRIDGRDIHASAGDVLFYRSGEAHKEWTEPRQSLLTLFISFRWKPVPEGIPTLLRDSKRHIRTLAGWMADERQRESPVSEALYDAYLKGIVAEMVRLSRHTHDEFGKLVTETRDHVHANIDEHINLDMLARRSDMSKYHFVRRYKALTGRTPMEDVRMLRLNHARDLILTTSLPLKEIASRTGLSDVYHMSRLFRRCLGMTPGSLRSEAPAPKLDS